MVMMGRPGFRSWIIRSNPQILAWNLKFIMLWHYDSTTKLIYRNQLNISLKIAQKSLFFLVKIQGKKLIGGNQINRGLSV